MQIPSSTKWELDLNQNAHQDTFQLKNSIIQWNVLSPGMWLTGENLQRIPPSPPTTGEGRLVLFPQWLYKDSLGIGQSQESLQQA